MKKNPLTAEKLPERKPLEKENGVKKTRSQESV
jgi:hypothetical protein